MRPLEEIKKNKNLTIWNETPDGFNGVINIFGNCCTVVCSWGGGWDHVSIAPVKRTLMPTWNMMCELKEIFFRDDEYAVQYHPPKSKNVSMVNNCLHIWKPTKAELTVPPSIMVGF